MAALDSRNKILCTASKLFKVQGYHATGLNQIIKESGAPKGSIYHYFPNGKEELAIAAIQLSSRQVQENLRRDLAEIADPIQSILHFVNQLADEFDPNEMKQGISISLLALETAMMSEPLRVACQSAVEARGEIFAEKLAEGGFGQDEAGELGMMIHLLIEGAITLSLTKKSNAPFRMVARRIRAMLMIS